VALGVGAAFDFIAGTRRRAPLWMQRTGLEWVHRFAQEPKRLWRRYLVSNAVFAGLALAALARRAAGRAGGGKNPS
jgi:N-acetylglucosaminyldiphosphoundecaprenol N-acetyl-beta-D-mannosaminyltransferase